MRSVSESSHWGTIEDLPADTFKSVGTRVNTVMVKI